VKVLVLECVVLACEVLECFPLMDVALRGVLVKDGV